MTTNKTITVAVTGAAGQIGYAMLFRIASGQMLGSKQKISLRLLELPAALPSLRGVAMELQDCAFPLLSEVICTDRAEEAFDGAQCVLLVGARPRGPGMERSDLLTANGAIFSAQGRALNESADPDARVLVVGNPANTNALIALKSAPRLAAEQFSAMTRLDHNRAVGALAEKADCDIGQISRVIIWGNHSTTQYPDLNHALIDNQPCLDRISRSWYEQQMIEQVQKRGAKVIEARGSSSAASAANAAVDHMHDWMMGTHSTAWTSMGVYSDGSHYDVPQGIVYSFPVRCDKGSWQIVDDLEISDFSRRMMDDSARELQTEKKLLREAQII